MPSLPDPLDHPVRDTLDENTPLLDILTLRPTSEQVFRKFGMKCPDCIVQEADLVQDACRHYNLDPTILIAALSACPLSDEATLLQGLEKKENQAG